MNYHRPCHSFWPAELALLLDPIGCSSPMAKACHVGLTIQHPTLPWCGKVECHDKPIEVSKEHKHALSIIDYHWLLRIFLLSRHPNIFKLPTSPNFGFGDAGAPGIRWCRSCGQSPPALWSASPVVQPPQALLQILWQVFTPLAAAAWRTGGSGGWGHVESRYAGMKR